MPQPHFHRTQVRLVQELAQSQVDHSREFFVVTMVTEPALKSVQGPGATRPLREGEEASDFPDSILAWFCDIRVDGSSAIIQDVIVPTGTRSKLGGPGSPVVAHRDKSGNWQVVARADRVTEFQSVKTYTVVELGLEFMRGLVRDENGLLVSPFDVFTGSVAPYDLYRGTPRDSGGNPITSMIVGHSTEPVPMADLELGTDAWNAVYVVSNHPDGTTTRVKRNP